MGWIGIDVYSHTHTFTHSKTNNSKYIFRYIRYCFCFQLLTFIFVFDYSMFKSAIDGMRTYLEINMLKFVCQQRMRDVVFYQLLQSRLFGVANSFPSLNENNKMKTSKQTKERK